MRRPADGCGSFEDKPAGLRTHMLVAGGAAALVWVGAEVLAATDGGSGDPNRALHAVVTGIGFLGAGTILRLPRDHTVVGLTTAASLLFAAGVGITVGSGLAVLAVGLTVLGALVLQVLGRFDPHRPERDGSTGRDDHTEDAEATDVQHPPER